MLATAADRVRKLKAPEIVEESIAAKPFTDLDGDWAREIQGRTTS